jgi:hypothetical protein
MWMSILNGVFFMALVLSMMCFLKVFFNKVREESFFFKGSRKLLKSVFICLKPWTPMLKKFVNEICERRYALWFATILEPVS